MKAIILLVCLFFYMKSTHALSCPCHDDPEFKCINEPTAEECPYGITTDVCGCCDACAKGPGDECGGVWGIKGDCGKGFTCVKVRGGYDDSIYFDGKCQ